MKTWTVTLQFSTNDEADQDLIEEIAIVDMSVQLETLEEDGEIKVIGPVKVTVTEEI